MGYNVSLAESGWKGLDLFYRLRPDAVLLDLSMPEMDGQTIPQLLRSRDCRTPIVLLVEAGMSLSEQQIRACGVTEIVDNTCSLQELGDTLRGVLINPDPPT